MPSAVAALPASAAPPRRRSRECQQLPRWRATGALTGTLAVSGDLRRTRPPVRFGCIRDRRPGGQRRPDPIHARPHGQLGACGGDYSIADFAEATYAGEEGDFGSAVIASGDIDGNGRTDLIVGSGSVRWAGVSAGSSPESGYPNAGRRQSSAFRARKRSPRDFFAVNRRSLEPRLGRVGRRAFGTTRAARTSAAIRSRASCRLSSWLRSSDTDTITSPSRVSFAASFVRSQSRASSVSATEVRTFQRSVTRLSVVLTCCPPGPPDRLVDTASSSPGIVRWASMGRGASTAGR